MLDLFNVLIRYLLVAAGAHLVATGKIDQNVVEPLIGAGMTIFGITWMLISNGYVERFRKWFSGKS